MMLLRTTEAAKILDISKATLETWRSRGGGPAYVKFNRAVRYRKEDLDSFVNSHARTSTSQKREGEDVQRYADSL